MDFLNNLSLDNLIPSGDFLGKGIGTFVTAIIILIIGSFIARMVKKGLTNVLSKTNWDEKLAGDSGKEANAFFGQIGYYLVMLFTLLLVLDKLGMNSALEPLKGMLNQFTGAIPNLLLAGIIGYVGYMLAKIVSSLVNLGGGAVDNWATKAGFQDTNQITNILQKVVFAVIFIPMLIQALSALQMEAISGPATNLLNNFMGMFGQIITAAAVLFIFAWGGKFVTNFLGDLLESLKVNETVNKMGLGSMLGEGQSASKIISNLLYFFIVFFGVITAVDILGLQDLSNIFNQLLAISGQILFGLVILAVGNFISKAIYDAMSKGDGNQFIANIVRGASLALFAAIALRQMGVADSIIDLAFGAIVMAVAVVVALAYGLGGREAAGEHFKEIIEKFKK